MAFEKLVFEKIDHETVVDTVVRQIEDLIVTGVLKEGTKLPPERELAETMDVSRQKIREALKRLEDQNLLRVRHGEGSYIAALTGTALSPAMIDLYARHQSAFYDYLEYRREQEGFAAALASERATKVDRDIILDTLEKLELAQKNRDSKASKEQDIKFHSVIVDASHNSTLIHTMASIYELTKRGIFYNRDYLHTIDGSGEKLLQQHKDIGMAIVEGRAEDAQIAARTHIDFVEKSFRAGHEGSKREALAKKRQALIGS
ncbi:FadR/GntR family transcriptional regulator [Hoeflea sp. TYP-13]|uniref:FadR/GntR family transcriptional regulator n=1 Tax=Hoeflea sp. TYP-13 TaxID=3230023 RepID=UPI0034C5D128